MLRLLPHDLHRQFNLLSDISSLIHWQHSVSRSCLLILIFSWCRCVINDRKVICDTHRIELQQYKSTGNIVLYHFVDGVASCSADPTLMLRRLTIQVGLILFLLQICRIFSCCSIEWCNIVFAMLETRANYSFVNQLLLLLLLHTLFKSV